VDSTGKIIIIHSAAKGMKARTAISMMLLEGTLALLHFYIPFTPEFVTHYTMKRLCRALQYDSDENTARTKLFISRYLQPQWFMGGLGKELVW